MGGFAFGRAQLGMRCFPYGAAMHPLLARIGPAPVVSLQTRPRPSLSAGSPPRAQLFLTTHGIIELDQARAYGNILVSKTERFDGVAAH